MHQFGTKVLPGRFVGYAVNAAELDWSSLDSGYGIHVKRLAIKSGGQKRNDEFVFPCRTGEILQEGQPLSTVVYRAGPTSGNTFNSNLQKKKKEKPEIQVQILNLDKISEVQCEIYLYRNHVAPRTKLSVPKDDFPTLLIYIDVQRNENEHGCTSFGDHRW